MADERDHLNEVRARVEAAHEAAEELVREAHRRAEEASSEAARDVPPRGWDSPRDETRLAPELKSLLALLDLARSTVPAEISQQLAEALRHLLLALRALIDFYLERLETTPRPARTVEDIPIE